MKIHEEDKILALLNYVGYTDDETELIIDTIYDKNRSKEELIELLEQIKNGLED